MSELDCHVPTDWPEKIDADGLLALAARVHAASNAYLTAIDDREGFRAMLSRGGLLARLSGELSARIAEQASK